MNDSADNPGLLRAYWWDAIPNFGDAIAPVLLKHVTGHDVKWVDHQEPNKVLATGSILNYLQPGDVVWGAGAYFERAQCTPRQGCKVLVLRGSKSAHKLGSFPWYYGDTALCLPDVWESHGHSIPTAKYEVGWIANHKKSGNNLPDHDIKIDICDPWEEIISRILSCKVIVSASLHGIVGAEAFGRRAVYWHHPRVPPWKFEDYLTGTERSPRDLHHAKLLPPVGDLPLKRKLLRRAWELFGVPDRLIERPPGNAA